MARIGDGTIDQIDRTILTNRIMPKRWRCPHCGKQQKTGFYADEILLENFMYLEHCVQCGYVHIWELKLTDDFKKKVVEHLTTGGKEPTPHENTTF